MAGMDDSMGLGTRQEVLAKLRQRYQGAGRLHRKKLIDQAVELLGYHRKSAIRALAVEEGTDAGPIWSVVLTSAVPLTHAVLHSSQETRPLSVARPAGALQAMVRGNNQGHSALVGVDVSVLLTDLVRNGPPDGSGRDPRW
jgi:hypothetical protein